MESAHRKIELQSTDDLHYLIANVTRLARAKIDQQIPGENDDGNKDNDDKRNALRRRRRRVIEEIVNAYIQRTFTYALPNLTINGLDPNTLPDPLPSANGQDLEEFEPYNHRLATRVQTLYANLEAETLALAQLRREAPLRAAQTFRDAFDDAVKTDEDEWTVLLQQQQQQEEGDDQEDNPLDIPPLERSSDVEQAWDKALRGLLELKSTIPATMAKLERAKRAVEYLDTSSSSSSAAAPAAAAHITRPMP